MTATWPPGRRTAAQPVRICGVDVAGAGRALGGGEADAVGGQRRPAGLVFDADAVPSEVHGLNEGGADAGHRVGDEVAGVGVGVDEVAGCVPFEDVVFHLQLTGRIQKCRAASKSWDIPGVERGISGWYSRNAMRESGGLFGAPGATRGLSPRG